MRHGELRAAGGAGVVSGRGADPEGDGPRQGIQVVRRAASVLRAVGDRPEGSRLGELARAVALPKATVHRIVRALADEQLLWSDADGRIWLGPAIGRLAHASSAGLVARLHPVLVDLGQRVDETVDLSVLDGDRMRFVDQVASGHRLRAVSAVGTTFPLHCTANGKATLAALPDRTVELLLPATLERFTEHTVTDRRVLLAELDRVRSEGVAWDRQELSLGIAAVGVALCDGGGPVAAVSVPVPTGRFTGREDRIREALLDVGRRATGVLTGAGATGSRSATTDG